MKQTVHDRDDTLGPLPRWASSGRAARAETVEELAFLAGARLMSLHLVLGNAAVPASLLRDRLALLSAEAHLKRVGRPERMSDLRDEVHLARPGDSLGPGGAVFAAWRGYVRRPLKPGGLGPGGPVAVAADILQDHLTAKPQDEMAALAAADAALSAALGWRHMIPLLSLALTGRDLGHRDAMLRLASFRAVIAGCETVAPLAADLARRTMRLRHVAPKLRSKGAGAATRLFESQDALSPSLALSPVVQGSTCRMTGRSARRLCDRLVALGAVRELTGRDSFRLYGL